MRLFLYGLFLIAFNAMATDVTTPGAIASMPLAPGMPHKYLTAVDMVTMGDGQSQQITVGVLPAVEAKRSLQLILQAMQASQYIQLIKTETLGNTKVASVHARVQVSEWWLVAEKKDLNLFVRVQDANNAFKHKPYVEKLIKQVRYTRAGYPRLVAGHYSTGSHYSGSHSGGVSVYSESGVTLAPNGVFSSSGHVSASGSGLSALSQGGNQGWWQVRGNRLLVYEPPETYYNYRYEAFSNGLHVYTENNERLLWVRE